MKKTIFAALVILAGLPALLFAVLDSHVTDFRKKQSAAIGLKAQTLVNAQRSFVGGLHVYFSYIGKTDPSITATFLPEVTDVTSARNAKSKLIFSIGPGDKKANIQHYKASLNQIKNFAAKKIQLKNLNMQQGVSIRELDYLDDHDVIQRAQWFSKEDKIFY